MFPTGCELVGEIEVAGFFAAQKNRSTFVDESLCFDGIEQISFLEQVHAMRQQALADDEARENLLLHEEQLETLLVQQRGGGRTRRPGADD